MMRSPSSVRFSSTTEMYFDPPLISDASPPVATTYRLLIPVSAILLGALFLGEVLEPRHFAGMALIGAGLAAIDGRLLRLFARRQPSVAS